MSYQKREAKRNKIFKGKALSTDPESLKRTNLPLSIWVFLLSRLFMIYFYSKLKNISSEA